ncbi:MAG: 30S ribosomal protein S9 [Leptospiraceae bacterium]|nr:30S ribosomal protein S9 [Leptospiraceae bacterium]MCP5496177.1 30S ribosomal protein S9 [Leptospiraceae bacterium]
MEEKKRETWTVGRRKTSVARLKLTNGSGKVVVNKKDIKDYVTIGEHKVDLALKPLSVLKVLDKYDLLLNVKGGGANGQVQAMQHAIARALSLESQEFRSILKKEGMLTRDPRMVERKKYGFHKARRGTQFSKR